jgi:hypothetical protein
VLSRAAVWGAGATPDASVDAEWWREGQLSVVLDTAYENEQVFAVEYCVMAIRLLQAL